MRPFRILLSLVVATVVIGCTVDMRRKPTTGVPKVPVPEVAGPTSTDAPATLDEVASEEPRWIQPGAPASEPGNVSPPTTEVAPAAPELAATEGEPAPAPPAGPGPSRVRAPAAPGNVNVATLRAIAAERRNLDRSGAYELGPGDTITVTVFDLEEMNRKVRVSRRGDVQLPLIGTVEAAGRSEAELADEIKARLGRDYLQNPQVDVFVEDYESQQVAVTGAVANPGLYPLTRDRYTILDMLSEAGGLTKDAGSVIEFIPARRGSDSGAFNMARTGGSFEKDLAGHGIQIELNDLMRGSNRADINVPVVAGDVIFAPEAGSFAIDGWVTNPGTYPITRGMTILGAISAGGGPLMPARLSSVELLRSSSTTGEAREVIEVDVDAIKDGTEADVELRSGDVIRIPANVVLVPPWAIYQLFRDLIRLGASVPVA